jgi:hypothetical protein
MKQVSDTESLTCFMIFKVRFIKLELLTNFLSLLRFHKLGPAMMHLIP